VSKREIKTLLENWNIGELISHRRLEKGVVNVNWIVKTTQGKYVLRKVTHFTTIEDFKFEVNYLTYLKKTQFSLQNPCSNKNKK